MRPRFPNRPAWIARPPSLIRIALGIGILSNANLAAKPPASRPALAAPDSLATQHVRGALGRKLDSLLTSYEAHGFAGTVLVVRRGTVVLLKGYGFADIPRGVRNGPGTRFEMNSITKMFTAVSILQLASQGKIRLGDSIAYYLGPFPASKSGATVDHLAMHTAGLVIAGTQLPGDSRDAFVGTMKAAPIESPPGTQYRYTNAGYSLLAAIVEVASGRVPARTYLRACRHAIGCIPDPSTRRRHPVRAGLRRLSVRSRPRASKSLELGYDRSGRPLDDSWRHLSMGGHGGTRRSRATSVSRAALLATTAAIRRGVRVACLPWH